MEQTTTLQNSTKSSVSRLTKRSKIITTIINAIHEKKGEKISMLDLRKIDEAVADFFIVCEASNMPQVRAIAHHVENEVRSICGENAYHSEGYNTLQWVLVDYVNVVVHVMLTPVREFYRLEETWSDAALTEIEEE